MIEIKIDARDVSARFSPHGIPEAVRNNLRQVIPDLTKRLGAQVESNLTSGLKSRNRLSVTKEMREDSTKLIGVVQTVWTGESSKSFIPQILESGSRAHPIIAVNARALRFFWEKLGAVVMFKQVWHPGFSGIRYMQNAFQSMETEIITTIRGAVDRGLRR